MLAVIAALHAVPFVGSQAARGERGRGSHPLLPLWGGTASACFRNASDCALQSCGARSRRPSCSPSPAEQPAALMSCA